MLKPCPFCGKRGAIIYERETGLHGEVYYVRCSTLLGGCGTQSGQHRTRASAISAWNHRAVLRGRHERIESEEY